MNNTSFAQEWVNKVGGTAKAVVSGKTNYEYINDGRNGEWYKEDRWRRWFGKGYDEAGCLNYPVPSEGVKWYIFRKGSAPQIDK